MVVMLIDNRPRIVRLTLSDIEEIIRCLEDSPHGVFKFMNYNKIIDKLRQDKKKTKRKKK